MNTSPQREKLQRSVGYEKTFFFYILIGLSSLSSLAEAGPSKNTVSTDVDIEAQITQLWTNEHPAKLFKCWGRGMQVEVFNEPLEESSTENSGNISLNHQNTSRPFTNFSPISGTWMTNLSAERIFTLSFNQKVQSEETTYRHHACSTEKMFSVLDAISTRFMSKASLFVPNDVYLIRVKVLKKEEKSKTTHQLTAEVSRAARLREDGGKADHSFTGNEGLSVAEQDQYFFVRPGERMDFTVKWESNSHSDASFDVEYEIQMIGQDSCERDLWSLNSNRKPNIDDLIEMFNLSDPSTDLHLVISRLACLRSPPYMGSLLYSHHATELEEFLSKLNQKFQLKQEEANDIATPFLKELSIVASMSLYDFARTVLVDLSQYCDVKPVIINTSGEEQTFAYISGFHFAARHWHRIRLLFDRAEGGLIPLFESFQGLLANAENRRLKFSEISDKNTLRILEQVFVSIFGSHFRTLSIVEKLISDLPQLKVNKGNRVALNAELRKGVEIFESFEMEFRTLISNFSAGADIKISAQKFTEKLDKYRTSLRSVQRLALDDMTWFEYDESFFDNQSNFFRLDLLPAYQDAQKLNENFVLQIGTFLHENFGKKIGDSEVIDFVRFEEMLALHQKVDTCLQTYERPNDEN